MDQEKKNIPSSANDDPPEKSNLPDEKKVLPEEQVNARELSPSEKPETPNTQPATPITQPATPPNMEVHHHTHAPHGKKTWKNYFWEFLMLFLAVFCGFLAEYQLEHVIEHQREKVFVKSMIEDLKDDHHQLDIYVSGLKLGLNQMDSMVTMLHDTKTAAQNSSQIYYFGRISPRLQILTNNSRTFDQLRNSGGFRLIRNANVSNKIMEYYGRLQFIRHLEGLYFQEFDEYKRIAAKAFDAGTLRSMEQTDGNISRQADNALLRMDNPETIKELAVFAVYMNGSRRSLIPTAEKLQQNGDDLVAFLTAEYKLK